ncbi:MAG: tripartite tricarboxylate transporter permease [Sphaerochaeta sp.]|uniref:tripartite tricarboxylate transporter permease n=1 Tax=Sphaerochaeta sp. TaxID=1972642 RepID=UPI002FCC3533
MEMFVQGFMAFFSWSSFLYMNIGLLLGLIFGAIPGLTVILCIVLFLPFTYTMGPIDSFMFLLGIYCAGGYGGSISAILINTPGTPHATATMADGYALTRQGKSKKALNIALQASTFGGMASALTLLFFAPQVAKFAQKMGTPEYFLVCLFGLTVIAGVSGDSLLKGFISGAVGLLISTIGLDPMTGSTRFIFKNINLYSGFDLVICLIGLFALSEVLSKSKKSNQVTISSLEAVKQEKGTISAKEYRQMTLPALFSAVVGIIIGIIPGTGASMASFVSYDRVRQMSKHKQEFGNGAIEGIAAAETANNAVTGATLIPLLTMGIPGDGVAAIMLGALMINGLTPGPNLFSEHGVTMYAIMIGLLFVNLFMFLQGKTLTKYFARVVSVPVSILTPIIVMFCFAGAFSVNNSLFDVKVTIAFAILAYVFSKLGFSTIPILLGLVLGDITEENFRRALILSDGSWSIFVQSPISIAFLLLIALTVVLVVRGKFKKAK